MGRLFSCVPTRVLAIEHFGLFARIILLSKAGKP